MAESQLQNAIFPNSRQGDQLASRSIEIEHASPLAPLRKQDAVALDSFFEHEQIEEITLDVYRHLARMYPEPCWEDELYDFFSALFG